MLTGKLGSGKSLNAVARMQKYLNEDKMVATNIDLHLPFLINPKSKNARVLRLPDKPNVQDLQMLPRPYHGEYDEEKSGLLVLDECGTWFNTREYRDKERAPLIDHILHIRKKGWDVIFIVQHIEMIDKQIREGVGEHIIYCSRSDRMGIPIISFLFKLVGMDIRMPKIHVATVRYGSGQNAPVVDRWIKSGTELYKAYDTSQVFGLNKCGLHSLLPPYSYYGSQIDEKRLLKAKLYNTSFRIIEKTAKAKPLFFLIGALLSFVAIHVFTDNKAQATTNESKLTKLKEEPGTKEKLLDQDEETPFKGWHISASVKKTNGFLYVFTDAQDNYIYSDEGISYNVKYRSPCHAQIIEDNNIVDIYCQRMNKAQGGERPAPFEMSENESTINEQT